MVSCIVLIIVGCIRITAFLCLFRRIACFDKYHVILSGTISKLLNVVDFGKVVENELTSMFTTRTIIVQVLTGYLLFSSIYSDYSGGI